MTTFSIFLSFIILQRIAELIVAKRNEKIVRSKGGVEFDKDGYRVIVLMHALFLLSLVCEKALLDRTLNPLWPFFAALFAGAQILRYWAITSLGVFWNTRILVLPNSGLVAAGPYKYFRHPNYIAVIAEIAVIPLIFSCYWTAVIFTTANLIVLRRRVRIEESALKIASNGD